jgi:hypothetical protein
MRKKIYKTTFERALPLYWTGIKLSMALPKNRADLFKKELAEWNHEQSSKYRVSSKENKW